MSFSDRTCSAVGAGKVSSEKGGGGGRDTDVVVLEMAHELDFSQDAAGVHFNECVGHLIYSNPLVGSNIHSRAGKDATRKSESAGLAQEREGEGYPAYQTTP